MITIDGSMGEGGGQILRSALGLSLVTGTPFAIQNIRAKRKKPGLLRQHLTAVRAAAKIGSAHIGGDKLGSSSLEFAPSGIQAGDYHFAIGTAGSTTLVLQAVLPALLVANGPSRLVIEGGTHNPWAPPFDFLTHAFLPLLERMGARVTVELERPGFYPAGGGRIVVQVQPTGEDGLRPIEVMERGARKSRHAIAAVANLPENIGNRELKVIGRKLGFEREELTVHKVKDSSGPGNIVTVMLAFQDVTEVFTGFGELGKHAEKVATDAVHEVKEYLREDAPVGRHLADQLLLPLAMAGGGAFRTTPLSRHTKTNIEVVQKFLPVAVATEEQGRITTVRVAAN